MKKINKIIIKSIIIVIMMFACFYMAIDKPTHYFEGKWYVCEMYGYDAKGNEIHYKNSNDYEVWREYDAKGNEIHFKDSDGFEVWYEYDAKGKMIHYKSNGTEAWYKYFFDKKNNIKYRCYDRWEW